MATRVAKQKNPHPSTEAENSDRISTTTEDVDYSTDVPLTLDYRSKIDVRKTQNMVDRNKPPRVMTVVKWLVTFFMAVVVLGFVTASKVSLIFLATAFNEAKAVAMVEAMPGNLTVPEFRTILLVMLGLCLAIPYALTFLRALWSGAFRKDLPWPSKRAIIWGIGASVLETFGLVLFVVQVIPYRSPSICVLLMACVFVFPILNNIYRCTQFGISAMKGWFVLYLIALGFVITGFALTISIPFVSGNAEVSTIWQLPLAVLCLSFAWSPYVQQKQIEPKTIKNKQGCQNLYSVLKQSDPYQDPDEDEMQREDIDPTRDSDATKTSRWKSAIILAPIKLILVGIFLFGLAPAFGYLNYSEIDFFANLGLDWNSTGLVSYLIINLTTTFGGYLFAYIVCAMCMSRGAFALPLMFATPAAFVMTSVVPACDWLADGHLCDTIMDDSTLLPKILTLGALVCLFLAQITAAGPTSFQTYSIILQTESKIFWTPYFNGLLLEQWLLLGRRAPQTNDKNDSNPLERVTKSKVFICTTMYRETESEMKQLLESISRINLAQQAGDRHFQSHVFFDGGVKDSKPSSFVLQLMSLLKGAFGIRPRECTKVLTPYGMTLTWRLPIMRGAKQMVFAVHLKDNRKVKNKKRWSQVMYMSYILDYVMGQMSSDDKKDSDNFILTTDADVMFTPESVEALLDLMMRDPSVGAVCARTHPQGTGPLAWYQTFEYAIGHWFQKAAEHVLGSVLCAPGCFSVFRCRALRDILPTYATRVEHAFEFLTKDMGEDRWLCTLMVQSGWRIEYCAASENFTHCPEEFDEFYKQRRRWIASTIANLMLLIKEWRIMHHFNHRVSVLYICYQALILISTLIGPGTVMLIVAGGVHYAWSVDAAGGLLGQIILAILFAATCLYTSQPTQLMVAKILTALYAILMAAVVVGTAQQVVDDLAVQSSLNETHHDFIHLPASVTSLYLGGLVLLFFLAAILHLPEAYCLLHGIWYLICLPSGYLILIVYSICNLTDRSWGTREEKEEVTSTGAQSPKSRFRKAWKSTFFCCYDDDGTEKVERGTQCELTRSTSIDIGSTRQDSVSSRDVAHTDRDASKSPVDGGQERTRSPERSTDEDEDELLAYPDENTPLPVEDWLHGNLKDMYAHRFRGKGFDDTTFISGMTETELRDLGIRSKGHLQYLLEQVQLLPDYEIETEVPVNAMVWLRDIGLSEYEENFRCNHVVRTKDMEVLKGMTRKDIHKELKITKPGHVKRLIIAIRSLRYPTETEEKILRMKKILDRVQTHRLQNINSDENDFWETLRNKRLLPDSVPFGLEAQLKAKLCDLRNSWLLILAVSNTMWLILIMTLASRAQLTILAANPLGLVFLLVFGTVLMIQFLSMLVHRASTLIHLLGRAPYKYGKGYNYSWAFSDDDITHQEYNDRNDFEASVLRLVATKNRQENQRQTFPCRATSSRNRQHGEAECLLRSKPRDSSKSKQTNTVIVEGV